MASKTLRNMLLSLAVVLIPVGLIMALFTHNPPQKAKAVDWQGPLTVARREAPYPVLAPTFASGWTATKAQWTKQGAPLPDGTPAVGNEWHMAWISPDELYYGLDQRDSQERDLIAKASRDGKPDGDSSVKGVVWTRYLSPDERTRALARQADGVTTVVSGDVPYANLEQFANTLA